MNAPTMCERARKGSSKRGNADACTAECGNLNSTTIPLLEAVYYACDVTQVELKLPEAVYDEETFEPIDAVLATHTVEASDEMAVHMKTLDSVYKWVVDNAKMPSNNEASLLSRAHAICMLSAELYDSYDWQTNKDQKYANASYSPDRIYKFYTKLANKDVHLSPTILQVDLPSSTNTSWCAPQRCKGLFRRHPNSRGPQCRAPKGVGIVFADQAKRSAKMGKDPLCADCVDALRRKW